MLVDSSSDNVTLTLPYAGNVAGGVHTIKKTSALNAVWIMGGGNAIDTSDPLEMPTGGLASVKLISDGSQWYILNAQGLSTSVGGANLVGWWRFDDASGTTLSDASGSGQDGTALNMSSDNLAVDSIIGGGVDFDGTDDVIEVANSAQFQDLEQVSVCAWVYCHSKSSWDKVISKAANNATQTDMSFHLQFNNDADQKMVGQVYSAGGHSNAESNVPFPINSWVHVAMTYDGVTTRMYIDGSVQSSPDTAASGPIDSFSGAEHTLSIGHGEYNHSNNYAFNGLIDDVRVYNRGLTSAEVTVIFQQGN